MPDTWLMSFLENQSSPLDLALFTSSVYLTAAPSHLPVHLSALPRAMELQWRLPRALALL